MMRRAGLIALVGATLAACAGLGQHEPIRVNLAGLESIPGADLEARFLAKVRVQNPNDASITYNGISAEVDLNSRSFASGVSDASGEIPRFGESVIELPLTVPATAVVRQVLGLFTGDHSKATYRASGFLHTGTFGRQRFDSTGEIELPRRWKRSTTRGSKKRIHIPPPRGMKFRGEYHHEITVVAPTGGAASGRGRS